MKKLIIKSKENGYPYLLNVEGVDCSGKSTLSKLLKDYLTDNYKLKVKVIHFPRYETKQGKEIKEILNSDKELTPDNAYYLQSLYVVDQCNFTRELDAGIYDKYDVLILDRYVFSVIPYTCMQTYTDLTHPMIRSFMSAIELLVKDKNLIVPDSVLFLNCSGPLDNSWTIISERLKNKDKTDINESIDKLKCVYDYYRDIFNKSFLIKREGDFSYTNIHTVNINDLKEQGLNLITKDIQVGDSKETKKFIEENKCSFVRNIKKQITFE